MALMIEKLEVQYLVSRGSSSESGSEQLPDVTSLQQHFRQYGTVDSVRDTGQGVLVSLRATVTNQKVWYLLRILRGLLKPLKVEEHTINGHGVQVDLVFPDVYGCHVTVTEHHVEVTVGEEVMNTITGDKQWEDKLVQMIVDLFGDTVSVKYGRQGKIAIMLVATEYLYGQMEWELFIVNSLIQLLHPFEGDLPAERCSIRDRCLDRGSVAGTQDLSATSLDNCHEDIFLHFGTYINYTIVRNRVFLKRLKTEYPELQTSFPPARKAMKIRGAADAAKKAAQLVSTYSKNLSLDVTWITELQAKMLETQGAQRRLQKSLDCQQVVCIWDLSPAMHVVSHSLHHPGPKAPKHSNKAVSVIAPRSDLQTVLKVFQSCFQTVELTVDKSQIPLLQSNTLKDFLDDLQRSEKDDIAPLFEVGQDKIIICDTESNIGSTCKAVLEFFHQNLMESHHELSKHAVKETITNLQPWQVSVLKTARARNQLPRCLKQNISVDSENRTVSVHAPFHEVDKHVSVLLKYMAEYSQKMIVLTAASTRKLQLPASREHVQNQLDREGILCDWQVQQGALVISAHHSDMQQVEHIFNVETETTQSRLESQDRQETDELQKEDTKERTANRQLQADQRQSTEQQTEGKQVQPEVTAEVKTVHREENTDRKVEKQTQTCITHQLNREQQTTGTPLQTGEAQTDISETLTRQRPGETEAEQGDTDDDQSLQVVQGFRLSSTQTDPQVTRDWTGHTFHQLGDHEFPLLSTKGVFDQPGPEHTLDESSSSRLLKPTVVEQEDRTRNTAHNATSASDLNLPLDLPPMLTEDSQIPDPTSQSASPPPQHRAHSSLCQRSLVRETAGDVSPFSYLGSDVDNLSSHGSDVDAFSSSSIDQHLLLTGCQHMNNAGRQHVTANHHRFIHPLRLREVEPVLNAFSFAAHSDSTDSASLNSVRSSSSSLTLEKERKERGQRLTSQLESRMSCSQSPPQELQGAHSAMDSATTQQPGCATAASAPYVFEAHTERGMNSTGPVHCARNQNRGNPCTGEVYDISNMNATASLYHMGRSTERQTDFCFCEEVHSKCTRRTRQRRNVVQVAEESESELSSSSSQAERERCQRFRLQRRMRQRQREEGLRTQPDFVLDGLCQLEDRLAQRILDRLNQFEDRHEQMDRLCQLEDRLAQRILDRLDQFEDRHEQMDRLCQLEDRNMQREERRRMDRHRSTDVLSNNTREQREPRRNRQDTPPQDNMMLNMQQQLNTMAQIVGELHHQLNETDDASNLFMIQNSSSTDSLSSLPSSASCEQRQQQQHGQHDCKWYDEYYCAIL